MCIEVPNIALAYAATHFKAPVIDLNARPEPKLRYLDFPSDLLGISVPSLTYSKAKEMARLYQSKYPQSKVVSVTGFLDALCCYPYLEWPDKLSFPEPFSDNYHFPDYELFDSFAIFQRNWQKGIWGYPIMTSQGCPFECAYCMSGRKKWRARSPENCYQELKEAKEKWSIKSFAVLDDCFNVDKERLIRFCELIRPLKLTWTCENGLRADRFDESVAKALASSGCKSISFGIESVVPELLSAIKKGETIEQIEKAVETALKYFYEVSGFFIIGLPRSSYQKDFLSLEWAVKKGINAHFSYYVPFDQGLQCDQPFYGEDARPVSNEYSKELQERIFRLSAPMRCGATNFPSRVLFYLRLIFLFDRRHLPSRLFFELKKFVRRHKIG